MLISNAHYGELNHCQALHEKYKKIGKSVILILILVASTKQPFPKTFDSTTITT